MLADLGRARQRALIVVAACAATLALAAPAGAVTLGVEDLEAEPDEAPTQCGSQACAVFWQTLGAGPVRAPSDGTITKVSFRTPDEEFETATLHLLKPNFLFEFQFEAEIPLEELIEPAPLAPPIYTAKTEIPVFQNEILALELKSGNEGVHNLFDSYKEPESQIEIFDPSRSEGESANQDESFPEAIPAIQYEFEAVKFEQPEEQDEGPAGGGGGSVAPPFTPPPTADVEVTKTFLRGKFPPKVGDEAAFLVIVRNNGPSTAQGVVLRDKFGRGLAFDKAKVLKGSTAKARCGGGVGKRAGALVCPIGTMAPGARVGIELTFGVTGKPSKGAGKGERRRERNRARVTSTAPRDPNPANNKDQAVARIGEGGAICPPRSVTGTRRNDRLRGSGRNETILGLAGNDRVNAKRGRDCVFGGEGRDVLIGGPHSDYIDGGEQNDLILAADGDRDTIVCAEGKRDRVVADRIDRVARSCERVRRR